jgi:hypothetical protein
VPYARLRHVDDGPELGAQRVAEVARHAAQLGSHHLRGMRFLLPF